MFLWLGFIICTAVIVYSGTRLAKYGDIIAEKTGMGRAWTGLILMASVTSSPRTCNWNKLGDVCRLAGYCRWGCPW